MSSMLQALARISIRAASRQKVWSASVHTSALIPLFLV